MIQKLAVSIPCPPLFDLSCDGIFITRNFVCVQEFRKTKGLDNPEAFKHAFTLLEVWTADYQLDNVDKLVTEIFPMCKRHGGQWYIKAVQVWK